MIPRRGKIKETMSKLRSKIRNQLLEHYLLQLCKTGQIPTSRSGTDYLINMDTLE